MAVEIRELAAADEALLLNAPAGVFDHAVDADAARAFLADPHHRIIAAIHDGRLVGFASAMLYLHPDKPAPECWINEVSVADGHRDAGIGKQLMQAVLDMARKEGAGEAWVLTHRVNRVACRLYESAGGEEEQDKPVMYTFSL